MGEIGSEFWDIPLATNNNELFPDTTQWYLSGRSALQAIIKELGGARSVSLPSWCCDSMVKPFVDCQFDISFYPVYWENRLIQDVRQNSDVLFLINYFGYSTCAPEVSNYKGIVIRDVTHSILSTSYADADYYFGSLRKWCGVWTGGYAWSRDNHRLIKGNVNDLGYTSLRARAMQKKQEYIEGKRVDKEYLKTFEEAEESLEATGVVQSAERDVILGKKLDVEYIKSKRRSNAEVLRKAFPDWLMFPNMTSKDCPMFVPVLVPDGKRDSLKRYLIKNEIYCPVHWPVSKYHELDGRTFHIYKNELSLVCDQRYTEDDMARMVDIIKQFMEG